MAALDKNNDGTVDCREWMSWIKRGMSRSMLERTKFRASTPERKRLDDFLMALECECFTGEAKLDACLRKLFITYDLDHDSLLNVQEVEKMILSLKTLESYCGVDKTGKEHIKEVANLIVKDIDEDKDNAINVSEFISWVKSRVFTINQENAERSRAQGREKVLRENSFF